MTQTTQFRFNSVATVPATSQDGGTSGGQATNDDETTPSGSVRHESENGEDYLVAPVVAGKEQVYRYQDGNHITSEFLPGDELAKVADNWAGMPDVIGHPMDDDGNFIPFENSDSESIGDFRNPRMNDDGTKLKGEAWLRQDARESSTAVDDVYTRLEDGEMVEVSIGYDPDIEHTAGRYNGTEYQRVQRNPTPDHLAILPDKEGNCSLEDGCGLGRANVSEGDRVKWESSSGDTTRYGILVDELPEEDDDTVLVAHYEKQNGEWQPAGENNTSTINQENLEVIDQFPSQRSNQKTAIDRALGTLRAAITGNHSEAQLDDACCPACADGGTDHDGDGGHGDDDGDGTDSDSDGQSQTALTANNVIVSGSPDTESGPETPDDDDATENSNLNSNTMSATDDNNDRINQLAERDDVPFDAEELGEMSDDRLSFVESASPVDEKRDENDDEDGHPDTGDPDENPPDDDADADDGGDEAGITANEVREIIREETEPLREKVTAPEREKKEEAKKVITANSGLSDDDVDEMSASAAVQLANDLQPSAVTANQSSPGQSTGDMSGISVGQSELRANEDSDADNMPAKGYGNWQARQEGDD